MKLNKKEIEILRNGLEVLIDCDTTCIEAWEKPSKTFRKIYPNWKQIIKDDKKSLKEAKILDTKLWKELKRLRGQHAKEAKANAP